MDSTSATSTTSAEATEAAEAAEAAVTAHTTCPNRVVFTERGNRDGWIATDHAVDSER